jgi:hypothetical protein
LLVSKFGATQAEREVAWEQTGKKKKKQTKTEKNMLAKKRTA